MLSLILLPHFTTQGIITLQSFDLDITDKKFVTLVDPFGYGKATTLCMVVSLEKISAPKQQN